MQEKKLQSDDQTFMPVGARVIDFKQWQKQVAVVRELVRLFFGAFTPRFHTGDANRSSAAYKMPLYNPRDDERRFTKRKHGQVANMSRSFL